MTIVGIGIDVIRIKRVEKIVYIYTDKFAKKILSNNELFSYIIHKNKCNFIAKIFSIKEAASKALGTGFSNNVTFKDFEVYHNTLGQPKIKFFRKALHISNKKKINKIHVSVTDEKKYVCSMVIFEK